MGSIKVDGKRDYTVRGVTYHGIKELSDATGISYCALAHRIAAGWDDDELDKPMRPKIGHDAQEAAMRAKEKAMPYERIKSAAQIHEAGAAMLRAAVIRLTLEDYFNACAGLAAAIRHYDPMMSVFRIQNRKIKADNCAWILDEIENFFASGEAELFLDTDGDIILERLREERRRAENRHKPYRRKRVCTTGRAAYTPVYYQQRGGEDDGET